MQRLGRRHHVWSIIGGRHEFCRCEFAIIICIGRCNGVVAEGGVNYGAEECDTGCVDVVDWAVGLCWGMKCESCQCAATRIGGARLL
eukprot:9564234-Ditylum_brightwellii.AAC.1